jgi:putative spermidine/putrescine transport system substrate-binding protein
MRPFILLALSTLCAAAAPATTPVQNTGHAQPQPPAAKPASDHPGPPALLAAIPPSAPAEKLRRLLLKPYAEATRTELPAIAWDGSNAGLKTLIAAHGADLVLVDATTLADLCRSQSVIRLDWSVLDKARSAAGSATDCGAGAYQDLTVVAWDRAKLSGTPSWADFWDIARHPGRRGLQSRARGNLEIALLADGVSPGDIYRTLRSADGLERAFRKLDQLKPYIVWWDQPAQAAELLASGKALLTSAPVAAIVAAQASHSDLGFSQAGSLTAWLSWAIPQGAPHPPAATLALIIAADPARQAEFARSAGLGPATTLALDLLPTETGSQKLAIDEGFWADNRDKLEARFAAWLAR